MADAVQFDLIGVVQMVFQSSYGEIRIAVLYRFQNRTMLQGEAFDSLRIPCIFADNLSDGKAAR